jgi:pimeloyl-ACP methyl ester carboxylesterase
MRKSGCKASIAPIYQRDRRSFGTNAAAWPSARMTEIRRGVLSRESAPPVSWAQAGRGADIVLIHGAVVTLEDMVLALFPSLSGSARVTAFDRPGHGSSGRAGWTGTPWRQAATLHAAVVALGLDRPVIVGHSFGSAVAVAYGLQFPEETRGVVALSPIAVPEFRLEHLLFAPRGAAGGRGLYNAALHASTDQALLPILWNAMFLPQVMPQHFADQFPFERANTAAQMRAEGEDALGLNLGLWLSLMNSWNCKVPVEVIVGDSDKVVMPCQAAALAALLPDARLTTLPGLGHMLHHFVPEVVAAAALSLAQHAGPVSTAVPARRSAPAGRPVAWAAP